MEELFVCLVGFYGLREFKCATANRKSHGLSIGTKIGDLELP